MRSGPVAFPASSGLFEHPLHRVVFPSTMHRAGQCITREPSGLVLALWHRLGVHPVMKHDMPAAPATEGLHEHHPRLTFEPEARHFSTRPLVGMLVWLE